MFRIVRFPREFTRFFAPLEGRFHWDHFETRFNNFVLVGRWEPAQYLQLKATEMLTSEAQNELRRLVWRDLVAHLEELPTGDAVIKELDRLLIA